MIEAARLGIYVGADTDDAEKGIQRVSHQAEKTTADVSQKTSGWASGIVSSFKSMTENVGASLTNLGGQLTAKMTLPLVAAGGLAVKWASDLKESVSKVNVVFGTSAGAIQTWAETAATSFGSTKQQALEATGTLGNLFTSMGLGQQPAATMSMSMVKLAGDLASFNNIPVGEALEKLRSGLVGEAEPLRALGVNLSAADVSAKAMAMGLAASTKELTAADLVQARYALILDQTTTAQGDFARTSDGLANSQRILRAQLQDAGTSMGTVLLPIVTQVVQWISNLVQKFTDLSPEVQRFIVIGGGIAAALGPAITVIGGIVTALGLLLSPIGLVVAAVAGLALSWQQNLGGIQEKAAALGQALGQAFEFAKGKIGELTQAFQAGGLPAVGEKLSQWGQQLIQTVQTNAPLWAGQLSAAIGQLWAGLTNVVFPAIGEKLGQWWTGVVTYVQTNAPLWGEQLKTAIITVWASLTQFDITTVTAKFTELQNAFAAVAAFFGPMVENIKLALAGLGESLAPLGPQFQALLDAAKPVFEAIALVVGAAVVVIVDLLGNTLAGVINNAGQIFGGLLTAATASLNGIVTLATNIVTVVKAILEGDWAGAWTGAVELVTDLVDSIGEILGGLLEVIDGIFATIFDAIINTVNDIFGTNIAQWEEFKAGVIEVWETLRTEIETKLEEVQTTVSGLPQKLKDVFTNLPREMASIGANLITSLADALWERANSYLRAKAQGIANLLPDWVKDILGIASPSTVFAEIGENTITGYAQGMTAAASAPVTSPVAILTALLDRLIGLSKDRADVLREALDTVGTGLKAAMDALGALGNFKSGNLNNLYAFVSELTELLLVLVDLAIRYKDVLWWLPQFGEEVTAAMDGLLQAVTIIDKAGKLTIPPGFTAQMWLIHDAFREMLLVLFNLANDLTAQTVAAGPFAEALIKLLGVMAPLTQAIEAISKLNAKALTAVGPEGWDFFVTMAEGLMIAMNRIAALPSAAGVTDVLATLAKNLSGVVAPFTTLITFWGKLTDLTAEGKKFDSAGFVAIADQIGGYLVALFETLKRREGTFAGLTPALVDMATMLGNLIKPFTNILNFWDQLAGTRFTTKLEGQLDDFGQAWEWMLTALTKMDRNLRQFIDDDLVRFVDSLGELADGLQAGVELVNSLADLHYAGATAAVDTLINVIKNILEQLADAIMAWDVQQAVVVTSFAMAIGSLMNGLKGAADLLNSIPSYWTVDTGMWQGFITWIYMTFLVLAKWLSAPGIGLSKEQLDLIVVFSESLSSLMGGLKVALDLLNSIPAAWTVDAGVWLDFETWVYLTFLVFSKWLSAPGIGLTKEQLELIGLFGESLSSLMGGLKMAMDLLNSIPAAWTVDVGVWLDFETWVYLTFLVLAKWLSTPGIGLTKEQLELIGIFGNSLSSLMGGLKIAMDLVAMMPRDWAIDAGLWDSFKTWVWNMFSSFAAWLKDASGGLTKEQTELVGLFGQALSGLMPGLTAAALFQLRDNWQPPSTDVWDKFTAWVQKVIVDFSAWLTAGGFTADKTALLTAFGQALSGLMAGLTAAVAFQLRDSWVAPSTDAWDKFTAWVKKVIVDFSTWLATGGFTAEKSTLVSAFGQALSGVMTGLTAAVAFQLRDNWVAPSADAWDKFTAWVQKVMADFSAWLATGGFTAEKSTLVSAFGQALSGVMTGLTAAVAFQLRDNWVAPSAAVWDKFQTWVQTVFTTLTTWISTTFPKTAGDANTFAPVAAFGTALQAVFGGLQAALDFVQGFWFGTPNATMWDKFKAWLMGTTAAPGIFLQLQNWVLATFPKTAAEATTFAPVQAFATALSAIVAGLNAALDLFSKLESESNTYIGVDDRMNNLINSVDYALTQFSTLVASKNSAWQSSASAFATVVGDVFDVLKAALDVFGTLAGVGLPSLTKIQEFVDAVMNLFNVFTAKLQGTPIQVSSALTATSTAISTGSSADYKTKGESLGNNFVDGLILSLSPSTGAKMAALKTAAFDLGAYIAANTSLSLGIASPSRVAFALGAYWTAGLAAGMYAGIADVSGAAQAMAAAALPALNLGGVAPSALAVTQTQRQEFTIRVGGELVVAGGAVSSRQRDEIVDAILTKLHQRG